MKRKPIVIIEAPSNLGLMPPEPGRQPGTRHAPEVLRELGLHDRLNVQEIIRVEPQSYSPDDGRGVNVRNMAAIADHAVRLADAVEQVVRARHFPLVLGGDCSLLIGSLLGMRRICDPGLIFVDGHSDFFLPEQSGTGGAAGMDLALVTGWGPVELTDIEDRRPYVSVQNVAALGNRYVAGGSHPGIPDIAQSGIHYWPLQDIRDAGIEAVMHAVHIAVGTGERLYWIHMDVDVIDSMLMPAVDSPQADGFDWGEAEILLRAALAKNAAGLQVTIYDPDRDPSRKAGKELVELLITVLDEGGSV